jgi:hypothetical protein
LFAVTKGVLGGKCCGTAGYHVKEGDVSYVDGVIMPGRYKK